MSTNDTLDIDFDIFRDIVDDSMRCVINDTLGTRADSLKSISIEYQPVWTLDNVNSKVLSRLKIRIKGSSLYRNIFREEIFEAGGSTEEMLDLLERENAVKVPPRLSDS